MIAEAKTTKSKLIFASGLFAIILIFQSIVSLHSSGVRHEKKKDAAGTREKQGMENRQLMQKDDELKIYDPHSPRIRYAAFGSSSTWGAGYAPMEHDRHDFAYPWLLSKSATNLAIRAGGPNYPANCVSSMVGDDVYDVIVLEYFMMAHNGLALLARRLRERFPDALIIFLKNWYPLMITTKQLPRKHIQEWAEEKGFPSRGGLLDPKMHQMFKESDEEWEFFFNYKEMEMHKIIEQAAKEVGGVVSEMVAPTDPSEWYGYAHLFAPDGHHLSFHGHEEVANRVRKIVKEHGVVTRPRLGHFSYTDSCELWLQSGEINTVEYSSNGVVGNMPNTEKFALEFTDGHGWIVVNNPSKESQTLYIGYMTTGPPPSKYPLTQADVVGSNRPPVVLDPNSSSAYGSKTVHISKLVELGLIPPGKTTVNFSQIESAERPFRLVSVIITTKAEGRDGLESTLPGGNEG